jgi:hypothetical protein
VRDFLFQDCGFLAMVRMLRCLLCLFEIDLVLVLVDGSHRAFD